MATFFREYFKMGDIGEDVQTLQLFLQFAGYNPKIIADGEYGNETAEGVKKLQTALGFTGDDVDGLCGPKTRTALLEQRKIDLNNLPTNVFKAA